MSIAEAVLEKLNALPREKQEQVLNFVAFLSAQQEAAEPYSFLDVAMNLKLNGPPRLVHQI